MVFYSKLLGLDSLSNSDMVIYSYLMYSSLALLDDIYSEDGTLSRERMCDYFAVNGGDFDFVLDGVTLSSLSVPLGYSREQCRRSLDSLISEGYVSHGAGRSLHVRMLRDVLLGSYFGMDLSHGRLTSSKVFYFF